MSSTVSTYKYDQLITFAGHFVHNIACVTWVLYVISSATAHSFTLSLAPNGSYTYTYMYCDFHAHVHGDNVDCRVLLLGGRILARQYCF